MSPLDFKVDLLLGVARWNFFLSDPELFPTLGLSFQCHTSLSLSSRIAYFLGTFPGKACQSSHLHWTSDVKSLNVVAARFSLIILCLLTETLHLPSLAMFLLECTHHWREVSSPPQLATKAIVSFHLLSSKDCRETVDLILYSRWALG